MQHKKLTLHEYQAAGACLEKMGSNVSSIQGLAHDQSELEKGVILTILSAKYYFYNSLAEWYHHHQQETHSPHAL
jgi:hypothetical protein